MKAFRFQYQAFIRKLEGEEIAVQKQMSPFVKEYNRIQMQIEEAMSNLKQYSQGKQNLQAPGAWRTMYLRLGEGLRRSLVGLKAQLAQAEEKTKPFQSQLKQLFIQKRSLELLREKQFRAYKKQRDNKEQAELEYHFLAKGSLEKPSVQAET